MIELIIQKSYERRSKKREQDFTREREMNFSEIIYFMPRMVKESARMVPASGNGRSLAEEHMRKLAGLESFRRGEEPPLIDRGISRLRSLNRYGIKSWRM